MTTPESQIKAYLKARVEALGGEVRFVKWIGRRHAPDCLLMFPNGELGYEVNRDDPNLSRWHKVFNCWVETKAPGKRPRPGQAREHERMRRLGETVLTLPTKDDIDKEFPAP